MVGDYNIGDIKRVAMIAPISSNTYKKSVGDSKK
jgi:hypothetical protein